MRLTLPVLLTLLLPSLIQAQVTLSLQEKWTNLFGDKQVEQELEIRSQQPLRGMLYWTFAVEKRVITGGRGEKAVNVGAGQSARVKIKLPAPSVRSGVILKTELEVTLTEADKEVASLKRTFWVFPEKAFAENQRLLTDLKLSVLDVTTDKKTATILKGLFAEEKPALEELPNSAAVAGVKEGLLLVAEDTSFKEEVGLDEVLREAVRRGVRVLVLAPANGNLPWVQPADKGEAPPLVSLRPVHFVPTLDKRLDWQGWAGGAMISRAFRVQSEEGKLVLETTTPVNGWPFYEIEYGEQKGRLLACGLPLIARWESTPTARYLLLRLLERFAEPPPEAAPAGQ